MHVLKVRKGCFFNVRKTDNPLHRSSSTYLGLPLGQTGFCQYEPQEKSRHDCLEDKVMQRGTNVNYPIAKYLQLSSARPPLPTAQGKSIHSVNLLAGQLSLEGICIPDFSTTRQFHEHAEQAKGGITALFVHSWKQGNEP